MGTNTKKELLRFISEDIQGGDITSVLLPKKKINAKIISREEGILAGVRFAREIFHLKGCRVRIMKKDGTRLKPNQTVLEVSGSARMVLSCERTVLNLLSRMSGIATHTNFLVSKIKKINKKTSLYSTRKTAPGLRYFDKEAVKIGGGHRHRMALDDMVMIKDNHLLVCNSIEAYYQQALKKHKHFEVEVENQNDAIFAAEYGATIIMLDNFSPTQIKKTVTALQKKKLRKRVKLEASGGINSKNISAYAKTGVDIISVGSITNSVRGLDLSLKVCA